jgi:hypothetical protein
LKQGRPHPHAKPDVEVVETQRSKIVMTFFPRFDQRKYLNILPEALKSLNIIVQRGYRYKRISKTHGEQVWSTCFKLDRNIFVSGGIKCIDEVWKGMSGI